MNKMKNTKVLNNNAGFSLIEVMIGGAILLIIAVGMTSTITNMGNQLRGITQKQEIIELKNLVTQQMAKVGVCNWQLKNKVIDVSMPTSELSPSPTTLDLGQIYMGLDMASPLLAKAVRQFQKVFRE